LKGEVRVDQSENSPTILVSSGGWNLASNGTISPEDRVAWDFKVPRAGEISLLEKHQIVPIGGKKGTEIGTTGRREAARVPLKNAKGVQVVKTWWSGSGIGEGRRGWVGMVRMRGDRIGNLEREGGRRKWTFAPTLINK